MGQLRTYEKLIGVDIVGHSTDSDSEEGNIQLALDRVRYIEGLLLSEFPSVPTKVSSLGSDEPLGDRRLSNRVELTVDAIEIR